MSRETIDPDFEATPSTRSRHRPPRRGFHPGRAALALVLAAGAVLLAMREMRVREFETWLLANALRLTVADNAIPGTNAGTASIAYGINAHWFGLRITMACSVGLLLTVVVAAGALTVLSRRATIWRALLATAIGLIALVALNQVRLIVIALAYAYGGTGAYGFAHGAGGSVLMLVGLAGVLWLFIVICFRPEGRTRRAGR